MHESFKCKLSKCVNMLISCVHTQSHLFILWYIILMGGTWWHGWLRHCATSQKVTGSIPDGVIGIFHWCNPSGHTMALGLTQPLTEMSTRNISWGLKAVSVYGWQPYHLHVPIVLKSGSLNLLEPSGPVQACNGIALPLPLFIKYDFIWPHNLDTNSSNAYVLRKICGLVLCWFVSQVVPDLLVVNSRGFLHPRQAPCMSIINCVF